LCKIEPPAFVPYPDSPTRVACHHAGPADLAQHARKEAA
jgi:hypothetical protein